MTQQLLETIAFMAYREKQVHEATNTALLNQQSAISDRDAEIELLRAEISKRDAPFNSESMDRCSIDQLVDYVRLIQQELVRRSYPLDTL